MSLVPLSAIRTRDRDPDYAPTPPLNQVHEEAAIQHSFYHSINVDRLSVKGVSCNAVTAF